MEGSSGEDIHFWQFSRVRATIQQRLLQMSVIYTLNEQLSYGLCDGDNVFWK